MCTHTHIRTHNTHTYGLTSHITMKQYRVAKYMYVLSSPVSTGDSSEGGDDSVGQPLMEELGDVEGLLGEWGTEGDTVQGEVIQ